jgi:hypothetical protein
LQEIPQPFFHTPRNKPDQAPAKRASCPAHGTVFLPKQYQSRNKTAEIGHCLQNKASMTVCPEIMFRQENGKKETSYAEKNYM